MKEYRIAVLRGDGIGPEIVEQALRVLDTAACRFGFSIVWEEALLGGVAIDHTGGPLPEETVRICRSADAVLLGAVGGPKWDMLPGNQRPEAGLLGIRKALGLFANLRPAKIFAPLPGGVPLAPIGRWGIAGYYGGTGIDRRDLFRRARARRTGGRPSCI